MKFLFLKRMLNWPRAAGHDVHTFEMAKALARRGHAIGFATVVPPSERALSGLPLELGLHSLASDGRGQGTASIGADSDKPPLTRLQRRFLRYWGVDPSWLRATGSLVRQVGPDVVVSANLELLPLLAAVDGPTRVWYPADEYARHHLTQWKPWSLPTWKHLFQAAVAAVYERAFAPCYDRAWVVSSEEAWAMRRIGKARAVDVAPNGVDAEYFQPRDEAKVSRSCVFWGRLDSGPNVDAVTWFCRRVWPRVKQQIPDASLSLYGFSPTQAVLDLERFGVRVVADAPDLRGEVSRHEVAIMPFVSGGGIKNKLLEAAALGLPIVATPRACQGLNFQGGPPLVQVKRPREWVAALLALWRDAGLRDRLGRAARSWVVEKHTWDAAARNVLAGLNGLSSPVRPSPMPMVEVSSCPSN